MDYALAAMSQMELYCEAHPGGASAVRRPRLFVRGELWIALLGPSVEEGIVGIGATVTAALRAFDAQYLAGLSPRAEAIDHALQRSASSTRENSTKLTVRLSLHDASRMRKEKPVQSKHGNNLYQSLLNRQEKPVNSKGFTRGYC